MDLSGIGSVYSDYLTSGASSSKASTLESTLENASSSSDSDDLLDACKQFESYFVEQVFNAMIETTKVFSDDDEDGYSSKMVDYYKDFAVQELCDQVTESGSLGLANTLYEQMKRNYNIDTVTPEELNAAAATVENDNDEE
jgi:Rod binding domain-containing protein